MLTALTDPTVLTAILGAFGAALTWLWAKVVQSQKAHTKFSVDCGVEIATLKEQAKQCDEKVAALEGICERLTRMLHNGGQRG